MVAAANPLAVEAGYRILKQGGTAADAAVAVQLVLNIVEPQSSGIGGGAFMLYHDGKRHKLTAFDGRETAPGAATPQRFLDKDGKPLQFYDAVVGGKSVGVPGTLALLYEVAPAARASCRGRSCSSPPSRSRRTASRCRRASTRCSPPRNIWRSRR